MAATVVSDEDAFRNALRDAIAIVRSLAPQCKSPSDLVGLMELGLVNDGQLGILFEKVAPLQFRK